MMKRVLITGANSFLGDNVKKYLESLSDFTVDILDMLNDGWRKADFSEYDVVLNVCAIVHRFDSVDSASYYQVNKRLALEIANKAKNEGVKQFIQTSTNGVFGIELGEMNETKGYKPKTHYEKSKYEADLELQQIRSDSFRVCIIRPPLIYGNGCKGNFPKLEKFAKKATVFPSKKTRKDMIYIENMCDFIRFAIVNELNEICYPRDSDPVCVAQMIKKIAELNGKRLFLVWFFNPFVLIIYRFSKKLRSVFGDNYCTEPVSKTNNTWVAPYSMDEALKKMYLAQNS